MSAPTLLSHAPYRDRRGLTVLEVLVSAALAMVVILAMVQIFRVASAQITNARASLQMSGRLRNTTNQLRRDLAGLTVSVRPWTSPADGAGYFEYIDGFSRDGDSNGDGTADVSIDVQPAPNGVLDAFEGKDNVDLSYGDIDDVIMFTSRSDDEPFIGRYVNPDFDRVGGETLTDTSDDFVDVITSKFAEIVWWTEFNDRNANNVWDIGEEINVYRRTLLIRPDLNDSVTGRLVTGDYTDIDTFINRNDVSVRLARNQTTGVVLRNPSTNMPIIIANTLEDLTKRENRFAHHVHPDIDGDMITHFPYRLNRYTLGKFILDDIITPAPVPADPGLVLRRGEDVMLSNVLSFDVKAFDPLAQVQVVGNALVEPGDLGFGNGTTTGLGAFVDLGYRWDSDLDSTADVVAGTPDPESIFSEAPALRSQLYERSGFLTSDSSIIPVVRPSVAGEPIFVYDTSSAHYEYDGVNQEAAPGGDFPLSSIPNTGVFDQGTNNVDDDNINGTDDPGERETSPPYPIPMRGLQVTIRVIEIDTKQVRQSSVISNFTK